MIHADYCDFVTNFYCRVLIMVYVVIETIKQDFIWISCGLRYFVFTTSTRERSVVSSTED